ncbi:MAG: hypothetical protein JWL71_3311 [Acidobacteria bacterium]|nr:hypothetical protein [Acidobacteriota bacterium]
MKQLRRVAAAAAVIVAALAATSAAQTARSVIFVTNSYDLKVQQFSAGTSPAGTQYVSFGGEARAVNNKVAADLKAFAFTIYYAVDDSGVATVTDGSFLVQTTNKDRSTLTTGGSILAGQTLNLRGGGIAPGQQLSLSLVGSEGTDITGVITGTIDKSNPPRVAGRLSLTYPVVQ